MRGNEILLKNARELRKNLTRQERRLWYDFLRNYPMKIYKQKPVGPYIVDFCCPEAKLIIELDGGQHYEEAGMAYDRRRDAYLLARGFRITRYSNLEVDRNFDGVCVELDELLKG